LLYFCFCLFTAMPNRVALPDSFGNVIAGQAKLSGRFARNRLALHIAELVTSFLFEQGIANAVDRQSS